MKRTRVSVTESVMAKVWRSGDGQIPWSPCFFGLIRLLHVLSKILGWLSLDLLFLTASWSPRMWIVWSVTLVQSKWSGPLSVVDCGTADLTVIFSPPVDIFKSFVSFLLFSWHECSLMTRLSLFCLACVSADLVFLFVFLFYYLNQYKLFF